MFKRLLRGTAAAGAVAALLVGVAVPAAQAAPALSPATGSVAGGTTVTIPAPQPTTQYVELAAGHEFSLGLTAGGALYSWGTNDKGQLGAGGGAGGMAPRQVTHPEGETWKSVSAGLYHALAIDSNGKLWGWGSNEKGQLGSTSAAVNHYVPHQVFASAVGIGHRFTQVKAAAFHTIALDVDGKVFGTGEEALGDSTTHKRFTQKSLPAKAVQISAGNRDSGAVLANNAIEVWSRGWTPIAKKPKLPSGIVKVKALQVSVYQGYILGERADGVSEVYGWRSHVPTGTSSYVGYGSIGDTMTKLTPPAGVTYTDLVYRDSAAFLTGSDGKLYAAGYGGWGLGDGDTTNGGITKPKTVALPAGVTPVKAFTGNSHHFVIGSDGKTYGFGFNSKGQVGAGTIHAQDGVLLPTVAQDAQRSRVTAVTFGGVAATSVTPAADGKTVTATAPPRELAGAVDVAVQWTLNGTPATAQVYTKGFTYVVPQAAAITKHPQSATVSVGKKATFTVTATGDPAPRISWERSTDAGATWTTVQGAAHTSLQITATEDDHEAQYRAVVSNGATPVVSNTATLTVQSPPAITTTSLPSGQVGQQYAAQIATTGSPAPILTGVDLPAGLTMSTSGLITGTPTAAGTTNVAITATNAVSSVSATLPLKVAPQPVGASITSGPLPNGKVGESYDFAVTASGDAPLTITVTGLPAGLTADAAGHISGTPTTVGTTEVTVRVSNPAGAQEKKYPVAITAPPGAPTGLHVTDGIGQLGLSWTAVDGAVDYLIKVTQPSGPALFQTSEPSIVATGLLPGTVTVSVAARSAHGTSLPAIGTATVLAEGTIPPEAPAGQGGVTVQLRNAAGATITEAKAGTRVTVVAAGFAANSRVDAALYKGIGAVAHGEVAANGSAVFDFTVGKSVTAGSYSLAVLGMTSAGVSGTAIAPLKVVGSGTDGGDEGTKQPCTTPLKNSPFIDLTTSAKFYREISWMYCKKYTTGVKTAQGLAYQPKQGLTREAMAAFIYRVENPKNYSAPKVSPFADVKPGDKFYKEITWMHKSKLSTGIKQPTGKPLYAPKQQLTREAMAAFIFRLENPTNYKNPAKSKMSDITRSSKFSKEINWMVDTGLSTGVRLQNGSRAFQPKSSLSREAMAAFIYRLEIEHRSK